MYKLGKETAESNGQPYYPIYIFGPYKLLAVIAGCTVSFFWVLFPYPISAKSKVPRLVGQSLFGLAKIYSTMHSIVEMWISSLHTVTEGPLPAHTELTSTMGQEYKRELFLLESLKSHSHFAKFEPPTGGKFPVAIYNELAVTTHNCLSILALMGHTGSRLLSASEVVSKASEKEDDWVPQLRIAAAESAEFRSHSLTSLFCHLSSAMTHQQSLPPFLSVPAPFPLFRELQRLEYNTSSIEPSQFHVFRAFISLEVLRTMLHFELESLLEYVSCPFYYVVTNRCSKENPHACWRN